MNDETVNALRLIADQMKDHEKYRTDEWGAEAACLRDAADEIERLREALHEIAQDEQVYHHRVRKYRQIARDALGEKDRWDDE